MKSEQDSPKKTPTPKQPGQPIEDQEIPVLPGELPPLPIEAPPAEPAPAPIDEVPREPKKIVLQ